MNIHYKIVESLAAEPPAKEPVKITMVPGIDGPVVVLGLPDGQPPIRVGYFADKFVSFYLRGDELKRLQAFGYKIKRHPYGESLAAI